MKTLHTLVLLLFLAITFTASAQKSTKKTHKKSATHSRASHLKIFYPQPMKDIIAISFDMEKAGTVRVAIKDSYGKIVHTISEKMVAVGPQTYTWNLDDTPGINKGAYTGTLTTDSGKEEVDFLIKK